MIKILKAEFGRLEKVTDSQGNIRKDWRASYIGDGLIVWFVISEGEEIHHFIRFYINEPAEIMQRHLRTMMERLFPLSQKIVHIVLSMSIA